MNVTMTLNGSDVSHDVEPRTLLVQFIRDAAGLKGTNVGCDTTSCGACTVLLDGRSVKSCTVLAAQADGSSVTTIEGLAEADGTMHPVQRAFHEKLGTQCGFCTPGMIMAAEALLRRNPKPSDHDIRVALSGNLCRCTGYVKIIESVRTAAEMTS